MTNAPAFNDTTPASRACTCAIALFALARRYDCTPLDAARSRWRLADSALPAWHAASVAVARSIEDVDTDSASGPTAVAVYELLDEATAHLAMVMASTNRLPDIRDALEDIGERLIRLAPSLPSVNAMQHPAPADSPPLDTMRSARWFEDAAGISREKLAAQHRHGRYAEHETAKDGNHANSRRLFCALAVARVNPDDAPEIRRHLGLEARSIAANRRQSPPTA